MEGDKRRFITILAAVTLMGAVMRLYGINVQPPFSDEVQMAFTAKGYMEGGQTLPTMPHHPNLRNILIAWSLQLFGPGSMGLRFFSLIFGIFSVPLLGLVVWQITGRTVAACLAAFFLAFDPLHITFSIQAIQETHVVFFSLLGVSIIMAFLDRRRLRRQGAIRGAVLLPMAGIVFGLGISSKYQAVFPLLICLGLVVYRLLRERDVPLTMLAVLSLTVLPLTILALTDAPWFGRGYGLTDWVFMRKAVFERMSSKYVPALMELNPDRSAWTWFVKPFLGYASFSMSAGKEVLSVGMGNPLAWLLVLPASLFLTVKPGTRRLTALLQSLFWISYIPFLATRRPIFFLTALAVAPYAFSLVSIALEELFWRSHRKALFVYSGLILIVSILMLPLCMGKALDYQYTKAMVERFSPHPEGRAPSDR